jgi:hypothetical protein
MGFIAMALLLRNIRSELLILISLALASALSYIPIYLKRRKTAEG